MSETKEMTIEEKIALRLKKKQEEENKAKKPQETKKVITPKREKQETKELKRERKQDTKITKEVKKETNKEINKETRVEKTETLKSEKLQERVKEIKAKVEKQAKGSKEEPKENKKLKEEKNSKQNPNKNKNKKPFVKRENKKNMECKKYPSKKESKILDVSEIEELGMPEPKSCGDKDCSTCTKKDVARKELNKEFFDEKVVEEKRKEIEEKEKLRAEKSKNGEKPARKEKKPKKYKILGVMFEITRKRYYFEVLDDIDYKIDDRVIVDTARGKEIGLVYMAPKIMDESALVLPLKPVLRKATESDNNNYETLKAEAEKANKIGKEKIKKHELPMKLVATEFTFDKSKLIFYFTAEGRIDFRNLVKELATIFKLRIELRQIGVRDEARILGSIGICGKELCCRSYINKFDSVLIKMARDQGLVINPSKISGACGRLLCCIKYEYQQYAEALLKCPSMGQTVRLENSKGRVVGINPLNEYLYVDVEGKGRMRVNLDEVSFDKKEARKQHKSKKKTPEEAAMKGLEKE